MDPTKLIAREEDLEGYFEIGAKARERWGIGIEYERFGVRGETGEPLPYEGEVSVEGLLKALVRSHGWTPIEEEGRVIGASREGSRITLEPGGQLELSGAVHRTLAELRAEIVGFTAAIDSLSRPLGVAWMGVGLHPLAPLDAIPWIPKKRYAIMREYLPTRGSRAHVMMKQTACVQVNLDYGSEGDAMDKLRTAMGITPLVTALFANSPLLEGRTNGMMSYRSWVWRDTDPDRCGLLPFAFKDGAGFGDYLEYALGVPMFFVVRDGAYRPARGMTFRKFIRKGFEKERATVADFEIHLSTLFPEVRIKRYLEVRGADSGAPEDCLALAALWKGILYDGASRRAAWEQVRHLSFRQRDDLLERVAREGPAARFPGSAARGDRSAKAPARVRDLLIELVRLARQGLNNQGAPEEGAWLDRLERRLGSEGGCPAYQLAAAWDGPFERDPRRLVERLSHSDLA